MSVLHQIHSRFTRRQIDRAENLIIAVLVVTALLLVGKTGLFQAVSSGDGGQSSVSAGAGGTELSRSTPVALLVQNSQGRSGAQYDQALVDQLCQDGLKDFLTQAVAAMGDPDACSAETWQQAITLGETWVHYDFLYNVSFDSRGKEEGRLFLVTARNGWAEKVYYYDQGAGTYRVATVRPEQVPLPEGVEALAPTGGGFAFEDPALREALPGYMLVMPDLAPQSLYQPMDPLSVGVSWETLMTAVGFESRSSSVYQSADSTVIREGADTLRIQTGGTVSYHGQSAGETRFQAASDRPADLQVEAEEILARLMADLPTEATLRCQQTETLADGSQELTFCWMLDGARVQLPEDGWAARFVFLGTHLTSFEVHLRQYWAAEETTAILPVPQAAAAAQALGQGGKELQLCYREDGSGGTISAQWVVREPGQ